MKKAVSPARASQPVALVTGAADRIGATIARALARAGHAVIVHYRSSAGPAEALVDEIAASGGAAAAVSADLADRKARAGLMAAAAKPFGPITTLINNASLFQPDSVIDLDEALWDAHFAIHAEAPLFLSRDFAAQLPAGVPGVIINMIDERVLHPTPDFISYTLSKGVLWTATRTLAQSLAPAIRVNAIGPGPTLKSQHQTDSGFAESVARLPLERGADPEAIAQAVLFLVNSPAITGQMLALDGGEHLEWPERKGPTPRK
jgi:NAD(P)-dependent dehydrogenase (short-subunit alcohol dehydrogenase family)